MRSIRQIAQFRQRVVKQAKKTNNISDTTRLFPLFREMDS